MLLFMRMNHMIKSFVVSCATLAILLSPVFVSAQPAGGGTNTDSEVEGIGNPIKYNDLGQFIIAISEGIAQIGFYLVVIFIIFSGFLFVKARGNKADVEKAKETFFYTVIGAAILLGATVLANVISGTINQIRSDGSETTQPLP